MKKLFSVILIFAVLLGIFAVPAMAAENGSTEDDSITVLLNGVELDFDVPPQLISRRTMVPMRAIFEALGAEVEWYDGTQTITATRGDTVIIMQIDNPVILVNGEEIELDVSPQLVDRRTLVPARAVAESLDADVDWDGDTRTVIITAEPEEQPEMTRVGALYMDPMFEMIVVLYNADWGWYRQRYPYAEQVFFFNYVDINARNMISMSAFEFTGDAGEAVEQQWELIQATRRNMAVELEGISTYYKDRVSVQPGLHAQYNGYSFPSEMHIDGEIAVISNTVLWTAGNMLYMLTATACTQDEESVQEVQEVLDGVLESFIPFYALDALIE